MKVNRKDFVDQFNLKVDCSTCKHHKTANYKFPCSHCPSVYDLPEWSPKGLSGLTKQFKEVRNIPTSTRIKIMMMD